MSNQLTRRDFAIRTAGFGLAMGLAPGATVAEAEQASRSETSPAVADPYSLVDPELLPALKQFPAVDLSAEMVVKFRQLPGMPPLPAPAPQPVERHIPGPPGAPEVRLWVVDPAPWEKGKPVLLHMHGGGLMMPDPWLLPRLQGIATDCHCVVISVDYRLAPEKHYPGSLEDNYAALKWVHAHAAELGIDRSKIAVGGESGGGGHAASLAIHARDRNEVPIVFQLLIYPPAGRPNGQHPASVARHWPLYLDCECQSSCLERAARCSSGFVQGAGSCRTRPGSQRRRPAACLDRRRFCRPVCRGRPGVRAPARPRRRRNRASGRAWCLPRIRSHRAGR
jgi:pimeloyl-ACP methyl ester carboxylesterase